MDLLSSNVLGSDWWESGNFYQIYPRSFQDSNGDGIGDLNGKRTYYLRLWNLKNVLWISGITSRLDYLKDIGITATWLSPIFQSPMEDFGYDISDFTKIHNEYGTLEDFDRLVAKCRKLDIKLILDFVPNHTSDKHEWFVKSAARLDGYDDFYVWHNGKTAADGTRIEPSNWISEFRNSA